MDKETLETIKEITLNLESETTAEIVSQLEPILWWKLVYMPLIENAVFLLLLGFLFVIFIYAVLFLDE